MSRSVWRHAQGDDARDVTQTILSAAFSFCRQDCLHHAADLANAALQAGLRNKIRRIIGYKRPKQKPTIRLLRLTPAAPGAAVSAGKRNRITLRAAASAA